MAIRIDLLPRYVGLRRVFKRILVVCVTVSCVFATALFVLWYHGEQELSTLKINEETFAKVAKEAETAEAEATAKEAEVLPYKAVVDFIQDASKTGAERAALLNQVKNYVYRGSVVDEIDLSKGDEFKIAGRVRTVDDVARFTMSLRQASVVNGGSLLKDLPGGEGVKGYPALKTVDTAPPTGLPGMFVPLDYPLVVKSSGKLEYPVIIPQEPGGGAAAPPTGGAPTTTRP